MKYVMYGAGEMAKKYIEKNSIDDIEEIIDSNVDKVNKNFFGKVIKGRSYINQIIFSSQKKLLVTVRNWYPVCMKMAETVNPEYILYMDGQCEICNMDGTKVQYAYSKLQSHLNLDIFNEEIVSRSFPTKKVRFFMLPIVHAYSAIKLLVEEYIMDDDYDVCVIIPKEIENSIYYDDFKQLEGELKREKIHFINADVYDVKKDKPDICFFYLEDELNRMAENKPYCKITVAVQHRPILIHSTRQERIEAIFGNKGAKYVSFFVCNHFMTEWLSNRFDYGDKILDLGFPKLDLLYNKIHYEGDIPLEWRKKIKNRKVFLYNWMTILGKRLQEEVSFNTYEKHLNFLINFFKERADLCLIIRTRETVQGQVPKYIWDDDKCERFKTFCKNCDNIILDETETYYAAFACADGLLSSFSSIITYFLCMGKPVCFLHGCEEAYENKCNEWMALCENARNEKDIINFIDKVLNNLMCDSNFTDQYDGNACKRIKKRLDNELSIIAD